MKTVENTNETLLPITIIDLKTGHRVLLPGDAFDPVLTPSDEDIVKAGGAQCDYLPNGFRVTVSADNPQSCDIHFWKDDMLVLTCVYQDAGPMAEAKWNQFAEWDFAGPSEWRRRKEKLAKPPEPWFAMKLLSTSALSIDLFGKIGTIGIMLGETWRRLPIAERSPILPQIFPTAPSENLDLPCTEPVSSTSQIKADIVDFSKIESVSLVKEIEELKAHLKALLAENKSLIKQQKAAARLSDETTAALRQSADRLRNESSAKDARIKALEGEVSAITGNIERQVSEKVGQVRKTSEENELKALVAEDNCAEALRRADKAERVCKRLELLLRKNRIEPTMAFAEGDSVFHGAA